MKPLLCNGKLGVEFLGSFFPVRMGRKIAKLEQGKPVIILGINDPNVCSFTKTTLRGSALDAMVGIKMGLQGLPREINAKLKTLDCTITNGTEFIQGECQHFVEATYCAFELIELRH